MKPKNTIERTTAQFQTSTITYSQVGITYNSSSTKYGGSDPKVSIGPKNASSFLIKPINVSVE